MHHMAYEGLDLFMQSLGYLPMRELVVVVAPIAKIKIITYVAVYTCAYNESLAAVTLKP